MYPNAEKITPSPDRPLGQEKETIHLSSLSPETKQAKLDDLYELGSAPSRLEIITIAHTHIKQKI